MGVIRIGMTFESKRTYITRLLTSFSLGDKHTIEFLVGLQNRNTYIHTLERHLLNPDENLYFQTRQCSNSFYKKKWFDCNKYLKFDWSANSADLNPMENVCGIIASNIYRKMCQMVQCNRKAEFKYLICKAWRVLSLWSVRNLVNSMPQYRIESIKHKGNKIDMQYFNKLEKPAPL